MPLKTPARRRKWCRRLRREDRGVVVIEFAYTLPIFMLLGITGVELAHFAIANMRVSQITMTVADNISRAKQTVPLALPRLREVDINDNLLGAMVQGGESLKIFEEGRIIVSSLQQNATGRQWIAWQRCKGMLNVQSRYGLEGATQPNSGTSGFQGMGTGANRVQAEPNSAIIFAEVAYTYRPLFSEWVIGPKQIRREAAFFVRDDRDLTRVYNDAPLASVSSCNKFDTTF
ncbi:pilus assembly protein [Erythrobacteraceae bacterium CFH 75059]|uniref:TadE/TadG family type IV pilus assembly protein n=1 Tax=Qipengyuania thermophila TaxID=2509361 RepID=UPI00102273AD|nr:TadE family protein [Qipengyuania thermophila]TCD05222.1 pilus assembly protein [Erythrobacteraceae bacterium CFH 75059]